MTLNVVKLDRKPRARKAAALIQHAVSLADRHPNLDGFVIVAWNKQKSKKLRIESDSVIETGSIPLEFIPDFVATEIEERFNE